MSDPPAPGETRRPGLYFLQHDAFLFAGILSTLGANFVLVLLVLGRLHFCPVIFRGESVGRLQKSLVRDLTLGIDADPVDPPPITGSGTLNLLLLLLSIGRHRGHHHRDLPSQFRFQIADFRFPNKNVANCLLMLTADLEMKTATADEEACAERSTALFGFWYGR